MHNTGLILIEYLVLFLWCFLAASFLPLSSEPYFVALVLKYNLIVLPVFIASIGNFLGGLTTFLIAKKGGELARNNLSDKNIMRYQKAQSYTEKYGAPVLFLSWVPIAGDILVAIAGALNLPLSSSLLWMLAGKLFRYVILAFGALGIWNYFF